MSVDLEPAAAWLEAYDRTGRFGEWILAETGALLGCSSSHLRESHPGATRRDVELLWRRVADRVLWPTGLEEACRQTFFAEILDLTTAPLAKLTTRPLPDVLRALVRRVRITDLPAVLLTVDTQTWPSVEAVLRLARLVPGLPMALAVPVQADGLIRALSSLDAAMLRAEWILLPAAPDANTVAQQLEDSVQALLSLTPKDDAIPFNEVMSSANKFTWSNGKPRFRSGAEMLLFAYLQRWPETKDRFEPNARPGLRFRSRPAELDFYGPQDELVIELDGEGIHLPMNPQVFRHRYRTDREKDWVVQAHGLRILRFMSEDVGPRIASIRARVISALRKEIP